MQVPHGRSQDADIGQDDRDTGQVPIQLLRQLPLTQVVATHDLDMALELCDRTVVLSRGHIVYDGPTEAIMTNDAFLEEHALERPLSYSRPYCQLDHRPVDRPHPATLPSLSH